MHPVIALHCSAEQLQILPQNRPYCVGGHGWIQPGPKWTSGHSERQSTLWLNAFLKFKSIIDITNYLISKLVQYREKWVLKINMMFTLKRLNVAPELSLQWGHHRPIYIHMSETNMQIPQKELLKTTVIGYPHAIPWNPPATMKPGM